MIVKQAESQPTPADPKVRAGIEAERQMAFYLHREFASEPALLVLNDLRLIDPEQPEHDGQPGVCQIDHLVLHRWGAFIIESKSATDAVTVRDDGAGGDEWTRKYNGRDQGFPSPIQQARRQGEFLRRFLQRHNQELLGKMPMGLRTLSKLVKGTDQRGFLNMPIQIIVAISDRGKIQRINKWKEPTKPFRTFVSKADLVTSKIREEFGKHKSSNNLVPDPSSEYGLWSMKADEVPAVADFLKASHTPRTTSEPATPHAQAPPTRHDAAKPATSQPAKSEPATPVAQAEAAPTPLPPPAIAAATAGPVLAAPASTPANANAPACKKCSSAELTAQWGKFGYYWKCSSCSANTAMPTVCSVCGAEGQRGQIVRIRKEGPKYFRACERCNIEELLWTEPSA